MRIEKLRSCTKLERLREGCSASRMRLVRVLIASMGVLKAAWGVRRLCHVGEGVEKDCPPSPRLDGADIRYRKRPPRLPGRAPTSGSGQGPSRRAGVARGL